uniref:CopG family transcriptional regulator n=1 Tax=Ignisphaera aggregans TaxID=334771 RepID=A0A7C5YYV2_9CREN
MGEKVKTTIVIDRELWTRFKARILEEGVEEISHVIEEIIREEVLEDYIVAAIRELMGREPPLEVKSVKPLVETDAGKVVREMRDERI